MNDLFHFHFNAEPGFVCTLAFYIQQLCGPTQVVFLSIIEAAWKIPSTSQEEALVRRCDTVFDSGFFRSDFSASCLEVYQNDGRRHRLDGRSSPSRIVDGGSFIFSRAQTELFTFY